MSRSFLFVKMRYLTSSILVLLLALSASAYTISDYPSFYAKDSTFNAIYVVGEESPSLDVVSATLISSNLAKYNLTTEVGTSRLDTEIGNVSRKNAIVIGSPCENRAAAQLEGHPKPCHAGLGGSVGYIKLFEQGAKTQVLITGLTAEDRHEAANYLAEKDLSSLKVTEYTVPTSTGSTPAFFAQKQQKAANATNQTRANASEVPEEEPQGTVKPAVIPKETEEEITKPKIKEAEYEPIEELPEREPKGWWAGFWSWLGSLFS